MSLRRISLLIVTASCLCLLASQAYSQDARDARSAETINVPNNSAAVVNVRDFGAVGDGQADETEAFRKAMESLRQGGGTVEVPRGNYRFNGNLNVPAGVTIKGMWNAITSHNGHRDRGMPKATDDGTTFLVTANAGKEDAEAFITLNTNSVLQGVVLYWPDQRPDDEPIPYPWGIKMRGKNPAVVDVETLNPYNGIDASDNERALIRGVYGQPLNCGIFVDRIYDIGRIEDVHFNPWWSIHPKLLGWQESHGKAFVFRRTDWHYVFNTFCFGYYVGYEFGGSEAGVCNGNFLGIGADSCHTSVNVEASAVFGILITNGEFVAMHGENPTQVVVSQKNYGTVRFSNCAFWGPCEQIARLDGQRDSSMVSFSDCEFCDWDRGNKGKAAIQIAGGSVAIRGCNFRNDKPQVKVEKSTKRVIITDNFVKGKVRINSDCANARIDGNLGD